MMMPSSVRKLLSLWARIDSSAARTALDQEDAFLLLGRRCRRRISRLARLGIAHHQSLQRHGQGFGPEAREDVRLNRKPRLDPLGGVLELHLDLELDRFVLNSHRGVDRRVADLGDDAVEGLVGVRIDVDARGLPQGDRGNRRLVDLHLGFDHRHVRNRQQHRSRLVLDADHGDLPFFDPLRRHDAVHGRDDRRLRKRVLGALQHRAGLLDALLGGEQGGLSGRRIGPGSLEVGLGENSGRVVLLGANEIRLGLLRVEPRGIEILEQGLHRELGALRARLVIDGVELHEELTLLDEVPLAHGQMDDLARHGRRDVHLLRRLHLAVGAHLGLEVLALDLRGLDRLRLGTALPEEERPARADDHDQNDDPPDNLPLHQV